MFAQIFYDRVFYYDIDVGFTWEDGRNQREYHPVFVFSEDNAPDTLTHKQAEAMKCMLEGRGVPVNIKNGRKAFEF